MLFKKACTVYTCSTNYHLKKKIFIPETYQYPIPIIKHAAKQVKDQNIQINVDDALTITNKIHSNFKSYTLLLLYSRQKDEH